MRRFLPWLCAAVLVGASAFLCHTGNRWVLALAAGILAASLVFYILVTNPRRRAHRQLLTIDDMDGVEFENYVADLLRLSGYKNVRLTAASGDYGADLVAEHSGLTYIFQCKRYAKTCGVKSVQEICGAKAHYSSDVEVVVTNCYFTKNAMVLAEETDVELWDRDVLVQLLADGR